MRTRKEIMDELEGASSEDAVRLAVEVLLDIRDALSGSGPSAAEKRRDPRSEMTVEEIEKAFAPFMEEIKKKTVK